MLKDYSIRPKDGSAPKRAVIFLHGLGDSGSGGLLGIGEMWQSAFPDCEFLCPDAPFAYDMAPPELSSGRQWFSLQDRSHITMLQGTVIAAPYLNDYIDHVLATRQIAPSQLALVGFSQGTMMSLYVAPRRAQQLAGVLGYSGALMGSETLAAEKKSAPPVMLVHGTADDVVPFLAMAHAEQALKSAGIPVSTLVCPGTGHTIDDAGLAAGLQFLKKLLT